MRRKGRRLLRETGAAAHDAANDCAAGGQLPERTTILIGLVAHAVLAHEDALHDRDDGMMFAGALRCGNSILVGGGDIGEQVAGVLFADDSRLN